MLEEQQLAQCKSMVENAQSVVLVLPEHAAVDAVAAALAFHLTLREMGKESRLAAVAMPQFQKPHLPGTEQITTELGNQNLTISFDYNEEQVDKVSYHIGEETKKFYLTIKPRSGATPLDTNTMEFSYTGATADLIIYIGVSSLKELQQLYFGYEDLYDTAQSIGLSKTSSPLGMLQLVPAQGESFCQLLTSTFASLQFPITPQTASNLLTGIEYASKGLTQGSVTAETFESIAQLLRAGGERQTYTQIPQQKQNQKSGKESSREFTINRKNGSGSQQSTTNSKNFKKNKQSTVAA